MSILALFLIYWLLPNRKVEPKRVLPVAILVGLALEGLKYVNLFVWPFLQRKLDKEYSVFQHSVDDPAVGLRGRYDRSGGGALDGAPGQARSAIVNRR